MSRLSSAAIHGDGRVKLPTVVEELLIEVATEGFTLICCGPKTAPNALLASYEWDHYVDLLTVCDFDRVTTARVPRRPRLDLFAPEVVVWAYEGPAQHAVRALLNLAHPAHPDAPVAEYPAPASLRIPRARQRPMTIRPPSPNQVRQRAARLAGAMESPVMNGAILWGYQIPAGRRLSPRPPALGSRRSVGHQPSARKISCSMLGNASPAAQRGWSDAEGAPIALFCWVQQVTESPESGALFSRLHQRGEVLGLGAEVLYVRFAGESQLISVAPALVRVLDDTAEGG